MEMKLCIKCDEPVFMQALHTVKINIFKSSKETPTVFYSIPLNHLPWIGDSKLSSSFIEEVEIAEISAHPGFRMSCRTCNCPCDDIALLKLSQKLQFTANIRPIALPTAGNNG